MKIRTRKTLLLAAALTLGTALLGTAPAQAKHMKKMAHGKMGGMDMARYGGPVYTGAPALPVTASLVQAGGGADSFSIATALTAMVGAPTVTSVRAYLYDTPYSLQRPLPEWGERDRLPAVGAVLMSGPGSYRCHTVLIPS